MHRIVRSGIEHGEIAGPDQEGVRAMEGEGTGIGGGDAPHAGRNFHRLAMARVEIPVEAQRHRRTGGLSGETRLSIGDTNHTEGDGMAAIAANGPLVGRFIPDEGASRLVALAGFAILGSLILWASAKISVPFWPVPMTLQTGAVALIGAAYGWRLGLATVLLYLAEGALGLPVFEGTPAKGIGVAYMLGTTGGYLVGFAVAAAVIGWLAEHGFDRNPVKLFGGMVLADAVVFVLGVSLARFGDRLGQALAGIRLLSVHPRRSREAGARRLPRFRRRAAGQALSGATSGICGTQPCSTPWHAWRVGPALKSGGGTSVQTGGRT